MSKSMTIGALSKQSGLAASKIRFYESIGLLRMVKRKANGYREYPPEAATLLKLITEAQKTGFSLDELKALVPENLIGWNHDALVEAIETKLRDVEQMINTLEHSRAQLQGVLNQVRGRPADISCGDNARRIITERLGPVAGS